MLLKRKNYYQICLGEGEMNKEADQVVKHAKKWMALIDRIKPLDKSFGIYVIIKGEWLLEHGLAEEWYEVRGIGQWSWTPPGVEGGRITEEFTDRISLDQARLFGLCS